MLEGMDHEAIEARLRRTAGGFEAAQRPEAVPAAAEALLAQLGTLQAELDRLAAELRASAAKLDAAAGE